jgi:hypothetical protein
MEASEDQNDSKLIESLKTFVENAEKQISDLESRLCWVEQSPIANKCLYKAHHTNIADKNFDKHLMKCSFLTKLDYVSF